MKRAMGKTVFREIGNSLGRYLAILAITALGAGFLTGLRVSRSAMVKTADTFYGNTKFYDFRLVSTLGWDMDSAAEFLVNENIEAAESGAGRDALVNIGDSAAIVLSFYSLTNEINTLDIVAGRMPERTDECLLDSRFFPEKIIGSEIILSDTMAEEVLEDFACASFTVVGLVNSPLYLNYERGTSALGSGSVTGFAYIMREAFTADYETEIFLRLKETGTLYSDAYDAAVESAEDAVTELAESIADARYERIYGDARTELDDANTELEDAVSEYEEERTDAEQELADAWLTIADSRLELSEGRADLDDARDTLDEGWSDYSDGYRARSEAKREVSGQLRGAENQSAAGLAQLQAQQQSYDSMDVALSRAESEYASRYAAYLAEREAYIASHGAEEPMDPAIEAKGAALEKTAAELTARRGQLDMVKAMLDAGWEQYRQGSGAIRSAREAFETGMDQSGRVLFNAIGDLREGETEYEDGERDWDEGLFLMGEGLLSYEDGRKEADDAFEEAEEDIAEARTKLADAEEELADLNEPTVYVLTRDENVGYVCFDSDSSIVQAVATVFPLFFFLVAVLICMTTMTRMVDEQRTQIGVLKALGYGRGAIMAKYMVYSGSAAFIGACTGVGLGAWLFPKAIWVGYCIMYTFAPIEFTFNTSEAVLTVLAFMACTFFATLSACNKELKTVPADLIRPKSGVAGKRILLERIPFIWKRTSFMWKVSLRNVFRYRKRMLMMLLGIGGCTALIVTGFGINDSIKDIVGYQYDEIMLYDMELSLSKDIGEIGAEAFLAKHNLSEKDVFFHGEAGVDVSDGEKIKNATLMVFDPAGDLSPFMNMRSGGEPLPYPGTGEAAINTKLAEDFDLSVGDVFVCRDADMNELPLRVSGIFENYIMSYIFVSEQTVSDAGTIVPEKKNAWVNCAEGIDTHETAARLLDDGDVMSASVNADMRDRMASTMQALDAIVLLIIFCAGALAFIVAYNLTNINITERIREIATIQVLGFFPEEAAVYVFRENLLLTALGSLIGLGLGKLLHAFVMDKIRVDLVRFPVRIMPVTYLWSFLLTIAFALFVDLVLIRKLNRINMAEALKSVE